MSHTITRDADALTVSIAGQFDKNACSAIEADLAGIMPGITDLTVDLGKVDFISSMGLRLLLSWQKRMFKQGQMRTINASERAMRLFEETGFTEILDIQ